MSATHAAGGGVRRPGFRHEVRLYAGDAELVNATLDFVRDGVRAGEAVLVAVAAHKIDRMRLALGRDQEEVRFVDMKEVGHNPGTMIPMWRDFVDTQTAAGRAMRAVGEPAWTELSPAALAEFQHHETLLNVAFGDDPDFVLLCPYDTLALPPAAIDQALARHPFVEPPPHGRLNSHYALAACLEAAFSDPLPLPPRHGLREQRFTVTILRDLRGFVEKESMARGLSPELADDLVLAVSEAAANSIRHGWGHGMLRIWSEDGYVVCEVSDHGWIQDPMVGRRRPDPQPTDSRGLWLIHHLCDLVQIRSRAEGTVVRMHMAVPGPD